MAVRVQPRGKEYVKNVERSSGSRIAVDMAQTAYCNRCVTEDELRTKRRQSGTKYKDLNTWHKIFSYDPLPQNLHYSGMKKEIISYHNFIVIARKAGILDEHIDFMWNIFAEWKPDPADFRTPSKT